MFIAARGIIGLGLAFNITAAPLLLLELAYPTQRYETNFTILDIFDSLCAGISLISHTDLCLALRK